MPLFSSLPSMDRLPLNARAAVAVGLVVLLGAGGYLGILTPKLRELRTLKDQLAREVEAVRSLPPVPSVPPITEAERKLWAELEDRLRERYPTEPALPEAVGVVATLARSSGLELVDLEIQPPQPVLPAEPGKAPSPPAVQPPSGFAVNPSTVKLVARHRYRDLVEFLERLSRGPIYLAARSLEVKRVENQLTTEASFDTLRWEK